MRLADSILVLLISIGTLCISSTDGEKCSCLCCADIDCDIVEKPVILMSLCTIDICSTKCKQTYPVDCNSTQSEIVAICVSSASIVSSRYTAFTAFILATTAMICIGF